MRMARAVSMVVVMAAVTTATPAVFAQTGSTDPIEIPLRIQDGRLVVTLDADDGARYDFVLGLGPSVVTQSGAVRLGAARAALSLGGVAVDLSEAPTAPDGGLGSGADRPVGVIGSTVLNRFDVLIDAPNGRLLLKPVGRAVRWEGVALSRPVSITVYHDILMRADVEIGGVVYGGLLDLVAPALQVNAPVREATGLEGGRVSSFRMGYTGWPDLPYEVTDNPTFGRWAPEGTGFVIVGAAVAYDCAIAVSWAHSELRSCLR